VTYDATVTALQQRPMAVAATLYDGSIHVEAEFDLVIAADGLHSATRDLVLDPGQISTCDTATPAGVAGWPGPNPTVPPISARSSGEPASSSAPIR